MWANRLSYSVFVLELPPLSRENRMKAVMLKLTALYPKSCVREQVRIFKNGRRKNSWLIYVFPLVPEKKKEAVSSLTVIRRLERFEGDVWFAVDDWIETLRFASGGIENSSAVGWNGHCPVVGEGSAVTAVFSTLKYENIFESLWITRKKSFFRIEENPSPFGRTAYVYRYSRAEKMRTFLGFAVFVLLFVLFINGAFTRYASGQRLEAENRRVQEEKLRLAAAEEEKKKKYFESLKLDFEQRESSKILPAYTACSFIYDCLGNRTRIDNLSIAGNTFQLDAFDSNSLAVLRRFEENPRVRSIKMSRSAQDGGNEYFSLSGELIRPVVYADEQLGLDARITYYEHSLAEDRRLQAEKAVRTPSGFASSIRTLLVKYACTEEYLQYVQAADGFELECSVRGSSSRFLRFLRDASLMCDFSAVRVKNTSDRDEVSAFFRIKTGIDPAALLKEFRSGSAAFAVAQAKPEEIGKAFFVPLPAVAKQPEVLPPAPKPEPPRIVVKNPSFLQYLGMAGTAKGTRYVFIKNTRDNELYKLPLDSDEENSCRTLSETRFEVRLGKELYEVSK